MFREHTKPNMIASSVGPEGLKVDEFHKTFYNVGSMWCQEVLCTVSSGLCQHKMNISNNQTVTTDRCLHIWGSVGNTVYTT